MRHQTLTETHAAIMAARDAWLAMSPEERAASIREDARKAQEAAERVDRIASADLDAVLAAFQELAKGVRPASPEERAAYFWKKRVAPAMREAGIEERHRRRIVDWKCAPQDFAFRKVKELCSNTGAIVILAGNRGTGKTTIPCQLMRERIEAWVEWNDTLPEERTGKMPMEAGRYEKLARLGSMFKPLYSDIGTIRGERLTGLFEAWCSAPFLAIDEIHEAEDLRAATRMLIDLLDRRYAAQLDTVLISNHSPEICRSEMNASILSRLGQCGAIIPCEWESWRAKKPQ